MAHHAKPVMPSGRQGAGHRYLRGISTGCHCWRWALAAAGSGDLDGPAANKGPDGAGVSMAPEAA